MALKEDGTTISTELTRWSGLALMLGGVAMALFVLLLFPVGGFFGAQRAHHPLWVPAHTMHFISALLMLFGLVGFYARQAERAGWLGRVGFGLAFAGTAMFVGTGLLTAFIWPVLADHAPSILEADGALFAPPASAVFFLMLLTIIPGYGLLAVATRRAGMLPAGGALLMAVGAVLAIIPPEPVGPIPWVGLVLGGILFGSGATWLGYSLWSLGGRQHSGRDTGPHREAASD
jgi:drug/metabolite transporter (DMT)-like permease